jgi:hypothetical protein
MRLAIAHAARELDHGELGAEDGARRLELLLGVRVQQENLDARLRPDASEVLAVGKPINYLLQLLDRALLKVRLDITRQAISQHCRPSLQIIA